MSNLELLRFPFLNDVEFKLVAKIASTEALLNWIFDHECAANRRSLRIYGCYLEDDFLEQLIQVLLKKKTFFNPIFSDFTNALFPKKFLSESAAIAQSNSNTGPNG